jgi:hypothetical protein
MSFRQGMALSYSWKQKMNTKSSTKAELVGVDDSLGYILWACYFMQKQGFDMEALLLYQDNMRAMLLKINGRASSLKRTKHIKVKYFLIKDKVGQGEVAIENYPTGHMWTDINTKPKQGIVYRVFRRHVMGIPADYKDSDYAGKVPVSPVVLMLPLTKEQLASQECVGGDAKFVGDNAKRPEKTPIPLTHASGNACISRHSVHTLATDRPKKRAQLAVDMAVHAPPDEPQQTPLIMVSGCAWSPGYIGLGDC